MKITDRGIANPQSSRIYERTWGCNYGEVTKSEAMSIREQSLNISYADLNVEYQIEPNT